MGKRIVSRRSINVARKLTQIMMPSANIFKATRLTRTHTTTHLTTAWEEIGRCLITKWANLVHHVRLPHASPMPIKRVRLSFKRVLTLRNHLKLYWEALFPQISLIKMKELCPRILLSKVVPKKILLTHLKRTRDHRIKIHLIRAMILKNLKTVLRMGVNLTSRHK
jgi:hypothetical protein